MKLEVKHLAPYFPYGLKFINPNKKIKTLTTIHYHSNHIHFEKEEFSRDFTKTDYKPILRPLLDLQNIIEQIDTNAIKTKHYSLSVCFNNYVELAFWNDYQKLLENHFDIFGLIKKGLAIDINTLSIKNDG